MVFKILLPADFRVSFAYGCVTTITDSGNKYAFGKFNNSVTSIPPAHTTEILSA